MRKGHKSVEKKCYYLGYVRHIFLLKNFNYFSYSIFRYFHEIGKKRVSVIYFCSYYSYFRN